MARERRKSMKSGESSKLRDSVRTIENKNAPSSLPPTSAADTTSAPLSATSATSAVQAQSQGQAEQPTQLPSYLLGLLWSTKLVEEHGTVDSHTAPVQEVTKSTDPGYKLNAHQTRISDVFLQSPTRRNILEPLNANDVKKELNDEVPSNALSVKLNPGPTADLWHGTTPAKKDGVGGSSGPSMKDIGNNNSPYSSPSRKRSETSERFKSPTTLWNPTVRDSRKFKNSNN